MIRCLIDLLLVDDLPHLQVLLLHVDYRLLRLLDFHKEVVNELAVVVLLLILDDQRVLQADALLLGEAPELL